MKMKFIIAMLAGIAYAQVSECQGDSTKGMIGVESMQNLADMQAQEPRENQEPYSLVSKFSDPSRFKSVSAPLKDAVDHGTFWGRQISEHQLFLHLGIEDAEFKQKALDLHKEWETYRNMLQTRPSLDTLNQWLPLLQKTRAFQIDILKVLYSGKWIGWIFPLFVNHITLELDYLVDKLNDIPYTADDEIMFWNRINSEHAAFAAHLLDPSERDLFLKADAMSVKLHNLQLPESEKEMWLTVSLKAGKELDQLNKQARVGAKANKVLSVIHPVLLDHVIREGERGIQTLEKIKAEAPESAKMVTQTQNELQKQFAELSR